MNKDHPQDRPRVARRKQPNNLKWGSLPLPGQLSFEFWYEGVEERKHVSSAEGYDPCSLETSRDRETA